MLRLPRLPVPLLLPFVLLSTGCASSLPAVVVPETLLRCSPPPPVPRPEDGDTALAGFLLSLAEAGEDCRTRLRLVGEIVRQ
jgi:hypothetical protein